MTKNERMQTQKIEMKSSETQRVSLEFGLDFINFFFLVNSNTYQNTHKNSNISVLNQVYNTLHNQNTNTKCLTFVVVDWGYKQWTLDTHNQYGINILFFLVNNITYSHTQKQ